MPRKATLCAATMVILLAGLMASCSTPSSEDENIPQQQVIEWKMATSWSDDQSLYTEGARAIADRVAQLSDGRLIIEPYPADALIGAFDVFDAVSNGEVECAHSWPGYWRDKSPTFELFSSIPNQMTQQEWIIWLYGPANGMDLWQEFYAQYNVIPFPGAITGPEFGFFTNQPIHSLDDFRGLKLRAVGMAADILNELGASTVSLPAAEIVTAMENGDIDGCEFSTPVIDWQLGFQEVAQYACLPSWHQPSGMYETIVNAEAWNELPDDLKAIFESACKEVGIVDGMAQLDGANAKYLEMFQQQGTEITVLDTEAINRISEMATRLADEQAAKDPFYARVLESQRDFRTEYRTWEQWGNYNLYP
ncbi:MAG: TRAP transporter substrate-binding protein DctP [Dehalococcoidales bacterium]|nr:TRAP transporter substrate-binding protein DctP [Dehalococcoidales bacterium]